MKASNENKQKKISVSKEKQKKFERAMSLIKDFPVKSKFQRYIEQRWQIST